MRRAAAAAAGLAAGIALALGLNGAQHRGEATAASAAALAAEAAGPRPRTVTPATGLALAATYAPVVRRAAPSVVNIYTARRVAARATMADFYRYMFGGAAPQPRIERSLGSGVIVDAGGLVITNNHVIAGADEILVALNDRRQFSAKLVFADEKSDLAVLRVASGASRLPTATLGDSDRAEVGDVVLAIGDPFGVGQTVTQGIVSATARTGIGISDTGFFLQTDAAINPGNSGGALVSAAGEVIGINTSILSGSGGSQGVGFAIPSNMVRQFLIAARGGRFVRAWLGATGDALTAEAAAAAGLDRPTGVVVRAVTPGSPAATAGIAPGDVVYAIDGLEVADPGGLGYRVATRGVGHVATLTVVRDRRARNVTVRLVAPPEVPARQLTMLPDGTLFAGVTIANLSPALAQELGGGLPDRGVVVVALAPGAPVRNLDFPAPGDIIESIGGRPTPSVDTVRGALATPDGSRVFRVNRAGSRAECAFTPPGRFGCRT